MAFFNQGRRDPYYAGVSWLCSVWLFSMINAVLFFFSSTYFVIGLTMTQLLLALPIFSTNTALILIVLLLGILVGCWSLAKMGKEAGLLVASLIYLADLIALIAVGLYSADYTNLLIDFLFHIVALVMMIRGFVYGVKTKARMRAYGTANGDEEDDRPAM